MPNALKSTAMHERTTDLADAELLAAAKDLLIHLPCASTWSTSMWHAWARVATAIQRAERPVAARADAAPMGVVAQLSVRISKTASEFDAGLKKLEGREL